MYKILSLFTGCGGTDIGFHGDFDFNNKYFEKLPFETMVAMDIDKDSCDTVKSNTDYFSHTTVINCDVTKLHPSIFACNEYDVLLGGFPCVTFSMAGKRAGIKDDINGKLYKTFARYVKILKPKVFIAENVKGILSANDGKAVRIIKKKFENVGYNVKIFSVNFADFGISQLRQRVLFIGVRNDIDREFIPPQYVTRGNHIAVKDVIGNIPSNATNNNLMRVHDNTVAKLNAIPEGGNYTNLPKELAVKGLMSNIYRKLHRDKPSTTIIASGGGGTWGYHYEESRPLTNRERARIQSFPDNFNFSGNNTEVRRQIGNAVPPVGIYYFAKQIAELLEGQHTTLKSNSIEEWKL